MWHRLTAAAAALILVLGIAGTALADTSSTATDPSTAPGTGSASVSTATSGNTGTSASDFVSQVRAIRDQIVTNRGQIQSLEQSLKSETQANEALLKQLRSNLVGNQVEAWKQAAANLKQQSQTTLKPLRDKLKDLESQLQTARQNKDQATVKQLRQQIADLRQQIQTAMSDLKGQRDTLLQQRQQILHARQTLQQVLAQLQPLWNQERTLWGQVRQSELDKQSQWTAFSQSHDNKDQAGMLAALNKIVVDQQSIISTLNQIQQLKQQVNQILQTAVSANPPRSGS